MNKNHKNSTSYILNVISFSELLLLGTHTLNKTKEDFILVTKPSYKREKRLLKMLKNKVAYRFSFNLTHGIYPYHQTKCDYPLLQTIDYIAGAGERIPTYRLVGTKFWGKYIQKDELNDKFGQNSSIVGTKFTRSLRVGTKLKNILPRLFVLSYVKKNAKQSQ